MKFITMILSTMISTLPTPAHNQQCGDDCVEALTAALEWALAEAPANTGHSDPKRTALDIEPRWLDRPPGALSIQNEVSILRQVAQRLGIEVVKRSEDEARQTCRKGWTEPACRSHWGRTLINVGRLHFTGPGQAEVNTDIEVLGDRMLGGTGGPYYSRQSTELRLQKTGAGWKVVGQGVTIIT